MKKRTISNYIYDRYNEKGMKYFERRVNQVLKDNGVNGDIICHNAWMKRASGYGHYYMMAEVEVNKELFTLKKLTTDSEAFDNWDASNKRQTRNLFLYLLSEKIDELKNINL